MPVKTLPNKITSINVLSIYGNTPVSNSFKSTKTKVEIYQRNGGNLIKSLLATIIIVTMNIKNITEGINSITTTIINCRLR